MLLIYVADLIVVYAPNCYSSIVGVVSAMCFLLQLMLGIVGGLSPDPPHPSLLSAASC